MLAPDPLDEMKKDHQAPARPRPRKAPRQDGDPAASRARRRLRGRPLGSTSN